MAFLEAGSGFASVTNRATELVCSRWMEQSPRQSFHPAGAGTLLSTVTASCVGAGALVGWSAGNVGYGVLAGAIVGVPAGAAAVYLRYRGTF